MSRALALSTAITLAAAAALAAQDAAQIVGRSGRLYRNLTSLQAQFVQIIEDRAQGDTLTSRGTVVQGGDNFFAMRFDDPPGEAIVVDGKSVWTYLPSTSPNEVSKSPIATDPVYGVNLLAKLLDRPQDRYRATYLRRDTASGKSVDAIELVPVSEHAPFRKARIWLAVDDGLPRRIELEEGFGARRTLILSQLRPNVPVSRRTFTFQPPPGVRVVERL
ncbi:MAG: outer membrane lipoprotein carrier protein LolA [Gemmatimonadetes bacterium]|nr:outer membrane lipoprotein carrier protein LolA [Gemmatimonadota bacterium]